MYSLSPISTSVPSLPREENPIFSEQTQKILLVALSALSSIGALTCVGLAVASITFWEVALIAIPLGIIALIAGYASSRLQDYDNPAELVEMRKHAIGQSFSELVRIHGLCKLKRYILSPQQLQEKFRQEFPHQHLSPILRRYRLQDVIELQLMSVEELKARLHAELCVTPFEQFRSYFSLSELAAYGLLDATRLAQLCQEADAAEAAHRAKKVAIDAQYPYRYTRVLMELDRRAGRARVQAETRVESVRRTNALDAQVSMRTGEAAARHRACSQVAENYAYQMAQIDLDRELRAIEEERAQVRSGRGLLDQLAYDRAMQEEEACYRAKMTQLEERFCSLKKQL